MAKRGLRVLVADDDRDLVVSLMALLRDEGHEVLAVHHGGDVVETVGDFAPDVLLTRHRPAAAKRLRDRERVARALWQRAAGGSRHHRAHRARRPAARRDGRLRPPVHQACRAQGTARRLGVAGSLTPAARPAARRIELPRPHELPRRRGHRRHLHRLRGARPQAGASPPPRRSSTPRDFRRRHARTRCASPAERLGLSFEQFCREVAVLTHGTTVGTNA